MTRCVACSRDQWLAELLACFLRRYRVALTDLTNGPAWLEHEAGKLRELGVPAEEAARDAALCCGDDLILAMLA